MPRSNRLAAVVLARRGAPRVGLVVFLAVATHAPAVAQDAAPPPFLHATIREISGRDSGRLPVLVSLGLPEGFTFEEDVAPRIGGHVLPAQVEVRARHADGSARHAMVAFELPLLPHGVRIPLEVLARATPEPPPFQLAIEAAELRVEARFEQGGSVYQAVLDDGARCLEAAVTPTTPVGLRTILHGPLVAEFESRIRPLDDQGQDHPSLEVLVRRRLLSDWPGVRIEVVVENCPAPTEDHQADLHFEDVELERVVIEAGSAQRTVLWQVPGMVHFDRARYRVVGWVGKQPPELLVRQDLFELSDAGFFPRYDANHPLSDVVATQLALELARNRVDLQDSIGVPLRCAPLAPNMSGVGDRPDVGPYARWHVTALNSLAPAAHRLCLVADGNGLGAFPIHERDPRSGTPGVRFDAPGRRQISGPRERRSPCTPDRRHTPSAGYTSYLLTGEEFFAEELSFWACYAVDGGPWEGVVRRGGTREAAWQLRNVTDAAFLLPDDHPLKDYLTERVRASLEAWEPRTVDSERVLHVMVEGEWRIPSRPEWVCALRFSPWDQAWFTWSLDNTARKGFPEAAAQRDWCGELLVGLYTSDDTFEAPDGKSYRFDPEWAMVDELPSDLVRPMVDGPGPWKEYESLRPIESYGEMFYYLLVNSSNEYDDTTGFRGTPPADPLPENWRIRSARVGLPGRFHESGNGVCAPTLVRAGLPGARRMVEWVRRWMQDNPPPEGRIPGLLVVPD